MTGGCCSGRPQGSPNALQQQGKAVAERFKGIKTPRRTGDRCKRSSSAGWKVIR